MHTHTWTSVHTHTHTLLLAGMFGASGFGAEPVLRSTSCANLAFCRDKCNIYPLLFPISRTVTQLKQQELCKTTASITFLGDLKTKRRCQNVTGLWIWVFCFKTQHALSLCDSKGPVLWTWWNVRLTKKGFKVNISQQISQRTILFSLSRSKSGLCCRTAVRWTNPDDFKAKTSVFTQHAV